MWLSMFDEIGVDFFDDQIVQLSDHLLWFLLVFGEFESVFDSIVEDVLVDEIFKFVSIFKVWEFADYTVDSV